VSRFARDCISIHGDRGEYLYVSENVEEMFGWKPGQLVGQTVYQFAHPKDVERLSQAIASHATHPRGRIQYRFRCADGTWRRVETRCRAARAESSTSRIVCLTRDVQRERSGPPAGGAAGNSPGDSSFLLHIEQAIAQLGFARSATAGAVARELGVGLRTLQRRLKQHSWTVSRLRNKVFQDIAQSMLSEGAAADHVTHRLGFSSRSSFQRAFRRWTGMTPGDFCRSSRRPG
jgi:PAS domain S-box-containing protein